MKKTSRKGDISGQSQHLLAGIGRNATVCIGFETAVQLLKTLKRLDIFFNCVHFLTYVSHSKKTFRAFRPHAMPAILVLIRILRFSFCIFL